MNLHKTSSQLIALTGAAALSFTLGTLVPQDHDHPHRSSSSSATGDWTTPKSIQREHEHLHKKMAAAIESGGETANAAKRVRDVLQPHFKREEGLAMPALSLLKPLSEGELTDDMRPMIERMRTLERELPEMLHEHEQIVNALQKLEEAATSEGKPEHAAFAQMLIMHAEHEEEILYPAAILVGKHLEMRFEQEDARRR